MELKRHQKDRGFGYKKAIQYPTEKELTMEKQLAWFNHFVDYVNQVDPNIYNEACEYSDNAEESV